MAHVPFGFFVESHEDWGGEENKIVYEIALPHQCDSWMIASESTKEDALIQLRAFIEEAQSLANRIAAGEWPEEG